MPSVPDGTSRTSLNVAAPTADSATRASCASSVATASNSTDWPCATRVIGTTVRRTIWGGSLAAMAIVLREGGRAIADLVKGRGVHRSASVTPAGTVVVAANGDSSPTTTAARRANQVLDPADVAAARRRRRGDRDVSAGPCSAADLERSDLWRESCRLCRTERDRRRRPAGCRPCRSTPVSVAV